MDSYRNDLVYVIIPVFNTEAYLKRCLDSILNNSYRRLQIICINDGSTDNSGDICEAYSHWDERIEVIHTSNHRVSSARNTGLERAVGEWIAFIDSDDWIHPQFFELLLSAERMTGAKVISADLVHVFEFAPSSLIDPSTIVPQIIGKPLSWNGRYYVTGKLYNREIIKGFLFDETARYGEDTLFNCDFLLRTDCIIAYINYGLYSYFTRSGSLSNVNQQSKRIDLCFDYLKRAHAADTVDSEYFYLTSAIKRGLSNRYDSSRIGNLKDTIRSCNKIIKSGLQELKHNKRVGKKEYFSYKLFYFFPAIYRLCSGPAEIAPTGSVKNANCGSIKETNYERKITPLKNSCGCKSAKPALQALVYTFA